MSWSYRPALDGLRAVAVYLVLFFHAGMTQAGGGFIGVDLFFVLSGFLVSNVILSEISDSGRLDLGRFYARRIRRLLPAAVVVIVATSAMFLLVAPLVRRLPLVRDAQSALLYAANWNFLFKGNDYFAEGVTRSPFLHFWSLSIEEQFYFVFPVILVLLTSATRRWRGAMLGTLSGLFVLSLGSQLYWAQHNVSWAYYGTDARLYQLLAGAILAVVLRSGRLAAGPRTSSAAAVVGLLALLGLGSSLVSISVSVRGVAATSASVLVIGALMAGQLGLVGRLLSRRSPVYLGQISYGTYLWHWPVILLIHEFLTVRPAVVAVLAVVLSTGLAALSSQLLETPIRAAQSLRRFRWSTLLVGVTASALVALTVVPVVLQSQRRPRIIQAAGAGPVRGVLAGPSRGGASTQDVRVPTDINWQALLDDKGPMPDCPADDPAECTVVRGHGPHILLVGDSHARMLGPMFIKLAKEHDLTLSLNVMAACPWQAGLVNRFMSAEDQRACEDRRAAWYEKALPRLDPDVVVLATISRDAHKTWDGNLYRAGHPGDSLDEANLASSRATVSTIRKQGARVLIVDPMLGTGGRDPLDCLSVAVWASQCQVEYPAEPPVSEAYYRILADELDDVFTVDVNPVLCPASPTCSPILDDMVVWKNQGHYTTTILTHFRAQIWRRILGTGVLRGLG